MSAVANRTADPLTITTPTGKSIAPGTPLARLQSPPLQGPTEDSRLVGDVLDVTKALAAADKVVAAVVKSCEGKQKGEFINVSPEHVAYLVPLALA